MKLFQLVMWRMSTILVVILTCWAVLFYLAIMEKCIQKKKKQQKQKCRVVDYPFSVGRADA